MADALSGLAQQPYHRPSRSSKGFSGGAYVREKWPMGNVVTRTCGAICGLSCYITMYLQNVGQEQGAVGDTARLSPSWPIALSLQELFNKNFKSLIGEFEAGTNVEVEL